MNARLPLLHGLFLLSGTAGLIYQVAWVRGFALVFGGSVQSAAVVTATFLAGLGLGGWLAGRWADADAGRSLHRWVRVEGAIAALGLLVALVLPRSVELSVAFSTYVPQEAGWHVLSTGSLLARVAFAVLLLLPPASCMGATLTLLVRHVVDQVQVAGWRIGWLYGANTAGAALGAVLTETLLVPWLGLWRTQLVAVGLNGSVALAGSALVRWDRTRAGRSGASEAAESHPEQRRAAPAWTEPATTGPGRTSLGFALFGAGFAAMGLEMAWFRFFAGALGPYAAVFSLLLGLLLLCQAAGAGLAGHLVRRYGRARLGFALAQSALVVAACVGLMLYDSEALVRRQYGIVEAFQAAGPLGRAGWSAWVSGVTITSLVAVPAAAMGAAFPLGNAIGQAADEAVGRTVGSLYLATTVGNVTGALVAGFGLLPGPGLQTTFLVCGAVALVAPLPLVLDRRALVLVPGAVGLVGFASLPPHALVWATFPHGRLDPDTVLELREGIEQIVVVSGDPRGPARLWTTGHPMTSTTPHAQRYMRAMAHVPLLLREQPEQVLVICVGAGNTLHAASLHPSVRSIEAVDLSSDVLAVSPWFEHANHGVLRSDLVQVFVNDGRHHLLLQEPGRYDLITLEPPPLAVTGVSSLYASEFYSLAASRLAPDGVLAQWLPAYQVPEGAVRSLVRSFVDTFPHAVLLVGSGRELILLGSVQPLTLDPARLATRLRERPRVAEDLQAIGLSDPIEVASMFAAPRSTLVEATRSAPPVTDDRPLLESAQASHLVHTRLPADLFAPRPIEPWCPSCREPRLDGVLQVTQALYRSEAFLRYRSAVPDLTSVLPAPDAENATLAAIAGSESLTRTVFAPDALALRAKELWEAGERDAARQHLRAARHQAPGVSLLEELARRWSERDE